MIFNGHSTEEERGRKADGLGYGKDRIRLPRCRQPEEGPGAQAHPSGGGAVACLLLAIFSAFGYFHIQAIFIDFFCGLVKGLIGYGYWLLPPCCWWPAGSWSSTGGRPVRLRVWCALLTPVLVGCLLHLILTRGSYEWSLELVKTLWSQGRGSQERRCGQWLDRLGCCVFSKSEPV